MTVNPLKILTKPIQSRSWILLALLTVYVALTVVIFFQFVIPSFADDTTSDKFAVDTTVYVYFADSIREGRNDPMVIGPLLSFPNTLLAPVCMSLIFNNHFLEMLANYAFFAISMVLLKKSSSFSLGLFIPLMLLNPVTTTSLLCINKEILDLFSMSLFLYSRARRHNVLLLAALGLALFNRYEICVVMLVFLIAGSRLNPWKEKRFVTLFMLVVALNFVMPFLGGEMLAKRFEEAQDGRFIAPLDLLQIHYLYILVVIPKIAINLFGELLNPFVWKELNSWTYIMFFNNFSYVVLLLIAAKKRLLRLRNDFIYFGALGAVLVAQSVVVQPRYFYFLYILLCLEIAKKKADEPVEENLLLNRRPRDLDASLLDNKEISFG